MSSEEKVQVKNGNKAVVMHAWTSRVVKDVISAASVYCKCGDPMTFEHWKAFVNPQ